MKVLLSALVLALVTVALAACGGAKDGRSPTERSAEAAAAHQYRNDGDNDPTTDQDLDNRRPNEVDNDNDPAEERVYPGNGRYHDEDDSEIVEYGRRASAADEHAIGAIVTRYYAAAAAGKSAAMCSMLSPGLAASLSTSYGGASGPTYIRGAKTCAAVLSLLLAHEHVHSTEGIDVTEVRLVGGDQGFALLGSRTTAASAMSVGLEHGVWRISSLLASPLP